VGSREHRRQPHVRKKKRRRQVWECTVEPFGVLFRVMVKSMGLKGPAGSRLLKGNGKDGRMFSGVFIATTEADAQRSADDLQLYLDAYEDTKN
jgi:hypothetical protein